MINKIKIVNANVKAVLLYGADTWKTTVTTAKRIQTFVNSCREESGFCRLKPSVMNGYGNVHIRSRSNRRSGRDDGSTKFHAKP